MYCFSSAWLEIYWLGSVSWSCAARRCFKSDLTVKDLFFVLAPGGCAAEARCSPRSSRSTLALKDDVIILSAGKKIAEISVITSQLVIKV